MSSGYSAYGAYSGTHNRALRGAALQVEAFMKASRLLDEASRAPQNRPKRAAALRFNMQLWAIVETDMKDPRNRRERDYKQGMLDLCHYMGTETSRLTRLFDARALRTMSAVNREIVSGLAFR